MSWQSDPAWSNPVQTQWHTCLDSSQRLGQIPRRRDDLPRQTGPVQKDVPGWLS